MKIGCIPKIQWVIIIFPIRLASLSGIYIYIYIQYIYIYIYICMYVCICIYIYIHAPCSNTSVICHKEQQRSIHQHMLWLALWLRFDIFWPKSNGLLWTKQSQNSHKKLDKLVDCCFQKFLANPCYTLAICHIFHWTCP